MKKTSNYGFTTDRYDEKETIAQRVNRVDMAKQLVFNTRPSILNDYHIDEKLAVDRLCCLKCKPSLSF